MVQLIILCRWLQTAAAAGNMGAHLKQSSSYAVSYTMGWEPYIVVNKKLWNGLTKHGMFDQRFRVKGWDKASFVYEVATRFVRCFSPTATLLPTWLKASLSSLVLSLLISYLLPGATNSGLCTAYFLYMLPTIRSKAALLSLGRFVLLPQPLTVVGSTAMSHNLHAIFLCHLSSRSQKRAWHLQMRQILQRSEDRTSKWRQQCKISVSSFLLYFCTGYQCHS